VLKGGKKTIVIGVVDSGNVGFYRFGMGGFEDMPLM
jgi:tRNA-splicing endonuclease subunit Sen54